MKRWKIGVWIVLIAAIAAVVAYAAVISRKGKPLSDVQPGNADMSCSAPIWLPGETGGLGMLVKWSPEEDDVPVTGYEVLITNSAGKVHSEKVAAASHSLPVSYEKYGSLPLKISVRAICGESESEPNFPILTSDAVNHIETPEPVSKPPEAGHADFPESRKTVKDRLGILMEPAYGWKGLPGSVRIEDFKRTGCDVVEGGGREGLRKTLMFDVSLINFSDTDWIGPTQSERPDLYLFDECHGHYHMKDFVISTLYRETASGREKVAEAKKLGWCLVQEQKFINPPEKQEYPIRTPHTCTSPGLPSGWGDTYSAHAPGMPVDITDVPDGEYVLEVRIDPYNNFKAQTQASILVAINGHTISVMKR